MNVERKFYFRLFLSSLAAGAAVYLFLIAFNVKKTDISGTNYSTKEEILKWLKSENGTVNSLYTLIKVNHMMPEPPPAVEYIHASMISPRHISLKVKEKDIAGYMDHYGSYLCFDDAGRAMAILSKSRRIEGPVCVEGLKIEGAEVRLGDTLPVADDRVLKNIIQVNGLLKKHGLRPESIICEKSGLKLRFPSVEVLLGKSGYEKRIAQLPPILKKLSEKYADVKGTLHLENFNGAGGSVPFVPETEEGP